MHKILIVGSLAFDRIMDFQGKFADRIMPEKIHNLNVSFSVDSVTENFGGTAGNIAYSLSLLGAEPMVCAAAGHDFSAYAEWLQRHGISLEKIKVVSDQPTASAYIMTDQADNQITAFSPGALQAGARTVSDHDLKDVWAAVIAPGHVEDMVYYAKMCKIFGLKYVFDPGQMMGAFLPAQLKECIEGAWIAIANDYEMSYILKATQVTKAQLLEGLAAVITTRGEQGSVIETRETTHTIPPARADSALDPTGAGDAYRAGLLKGLELGLSWDSCGRMGSVAAAYTVEQYGTQTHRFTRDEFCQRYFQNYNQTLIL